MKDFQVYVEDIIDAINSIEAYTKGLTYEGFVSDRKTVDAVIRAKPSGEALGGRQLLFSGTA